MNTTRLVILLIVFFVFFTARSSAGQSRAAGNSGGVTGTGRHADTSAEKETTAPQQVSEKSTARAGSLSQIVYEGNTYTIHTCRELSQSAKNFDNESIAIQAAHILKTDFYDAYRRQIFVSDRTGRYERIFVELYSPLSAVLEKMEGRTGTLYGSLQCKPSCGSFIVARWKIKE
jgi:hypothetical protein